MVVSHVSVHVTDFAHMTDFFSKNRSRSHAFRSERMISYLKTHLTLAMRTSQDGVWIDKIPGILAEYNSRLIPGTTIRRDSVTKENYYSLLEELTKSTDPTMLFNLSRSHSFSPWLQGKLWKYSIGQKVLIAREADYEAKGQQTTKGGSFFKRSIEGAWAPTVRTIKDLWLKDSKYFLTPVYEIQSLHGLFYESEVLPALFAEKK